MKPIHSYGEKLLEQLFRSLGWIYIKQFAPIPGSNRKYDFCFYIPRLRRYYIIEWDGRHHFKRSRRFHKKKSDFVEQQRRDYEKTLWAVQNGYYMIRLDHTCIDIIPQMLLQAVLSNRPLWFSNRILYRYITGG